MSLPMSLRIRMMRASIRTTPILRPITTSAARLASQPPPGNQPPSAQQAGRSSQPASDSQSSASTKQPETQNGGDEHPAKQPDAQAPSERSTGFHEVKGQEGVKGGKEGLDQRTDKNPGAEKRSG